MTRLVLLGTGLQAEELTGVADEVDGVEVAAYCENLDRSKAGGRLLGKPIVWVDDLPGLGEVQAVTAITTTRRESYVEQVGALGISFASLVHPRSVVAGTVELGRDVVVQAGAVVAGHTKVGDHVMVNRGALIGHHVSLGDYSTVQPGAIVAGGSEIGPRAYIGLGARVLERRRVGEGALVGAATLVTKDVEPHTQVVGTPAKVVKQGVTGYG
jgi:sugar O-acyltransferase (sialic acid O-acetyltransferase NeuD family)